MLFKSHRNEYVDTEGPVRYLDGSGLARPLDMPKPQLVIMGFFVVAAIAIGGYFLYTVLGEVQGNAARAQASVEENLAREVSYDLPSLPSLMPLDDETIRQTFIDAGFTTQDTSSAEDYPSGGFALLKLPSDVSSAEALLLYSKGISNLDAADAALLLNGAWTFDVQRTEGTDMRLRFADFSSGSVDVAVQNAMAAEGFDPATVAEDAKGIDEAGNTYQSGTIEANGTSYTWRVSAIALSSVYDISGLPESATYVGIRVTE